MAAERTAVPIIDGLRASGLLTDAQLAELAKCPEARDPAPTPLGQVILQRGWLTRSQLNLIAAGRSAELVVGPYLLLDRIGEGGMGTVYKATHQRMRRVVALKVIRHDRLGSPDAVKRFYREVEMAAALAHPNIVLAYDADETSGIHYLAMEYVDGVDLSRLVKKNGPLPVAQAGDYIRQAALGLQHAHEKGLVHRDIKPSNLLLMQSGGLGTVKLLDMGLARLQASTDTALTRTGAVMGTPEYMAPEQAMNSKTADIRADLYSLGCTLHYLLTGRPPFVGSEMTALLVMHQIDTPKPLVDQGVKAPKGVQGILDRLLAKVPDKRYATPAALAADLEPYCRPAVPAAGSSAVRVTEKAAIKPAVPVPDDTTAEASEPGWSVLSATVTAKPPAERQQNAAARRRRQLRLVAIVGGATAALAALGLVLYLVFGGSRSGDVAQGPAPTLPTHKGPDDSQKTKHPDGGTAPAGGKPPTSDPPDGPAKLVPGLLVAPLGEFRGALAFSPDGKRAILGSYRLIMFDVEARQKLHTFGAKQFSGEIASAAWSADGRQVLVGTLGGFDKPGSDGELILYEAESKKQVATFPVKGWVRAVAISHDGRHVLSVADSGGASDVCLWEVATGKAVRHYKGPGNMLDAVAFSDDDKWVFAGGLSDKACYAWPMGKEEGKHLPLAQIGRSVSRPVFSPDGREFAVSYGNFWAVFDSENGQEKRRSPILPGSIWMLGWSPDGRFLACGGFREPSTPDPDTPLVPVYLTDARTGKLVDTFPGHKPFGGCTGVLKIAVSPGGRYVLSSSVDGTFLWGRGGITPPDKPDKLAADEMFIGHKGEVTCVAFYDGGKKLVSLGRDEHLRSWDRDSGKSLMGTRFSAAITCLAATPDGHTAVAGAANGQVFSLDLATGIGGPRSGVPADSSVTALAISPNSRYFSRVGKNLAPALLPVDQFRAFTRDLGLEPRDAHSIAFSSNGKQLAIGADDGTIHLFDGGEDYEKPTKLKPLPAAHKGPIRGLVFVPKSNELISAGEDGKMIAWDVSTGREVRRYEVPKGPVNCMAISADGKWVAAGVKGGKIRLWLVAETKANRILVNDTGEVRCVAFSPDGKWLASCGDVIRVWDLSK